MQWDMTNNYWILFLQILSNSLMLANQKRAGVMVAALAAVEMIYNTPDLIARTPALWYALAELCNQAWFALKLCMDAIYLYGVAIISGFTTGMRESLSYFSWKVRSLTAKCCLLLRSSATARTKASTKTLSDRFSDL